MFISILVKVIFGMKSRRGVSEVISSLLVLFITVSIGVAVYAYATNVFSSMISSYSDTYFFNTMVLKERFLIEDLWFKDNSTVIITLFNYGSVSVVISAIFFNDTLVAQPSFSINPFQSSSIVLNYQWRHAGVYFVKIVSSRGVIVEDVFKAP